MRETSDKDTKYQNQLFYTQYRSKSIFDEIYCRPFLSMITIFYKIDFLKNFKIADKSSVRKLRAFYLLLLGENTK